MWTSRISSRWTITSKYLEWEGVTWDWYKYMLLATQTVSRKILKKLVSVSREVQSARADNSAHSNLGRTSVKEFVTELKNQQMLLQQISQAKRERDITCMRLLIAQQLAGRAQEQETEAEQEYRETLENLEYQNERKDMCADRIKHYIDLLEAEAFVIQEKQALSSPLSVKNLAIHNRLQEAKQNLRTLLQRHSTVARLTAELSEYKASLLQLASPIDGESQLIFPSFAAHVAISEDWPPREVLKRRKKLLNLYAEHNTLVETQTGKGEQLGLMNNALDALSQADEPSIHSLEGSSVQSVNHNDPDSVIEDCLTKLIT